MTREEAARRIKARFDKWVLDDEDMKAIQTLIPELKESEDERIRKALCEFISDTLGDELDGYDISKNEALAYLEKQRERKPAEWSKNDAAFLNEITDFFESKTVILQHDLDMYVHWLKSLPERFVLQPKQEWSKKDEEQEG